MKIFLFLAEGFEEIEAVAPVDIFRRASLEVVTVSITDNVLVKGAHGISVLADAVFDTTDFSGDFLLFLPGGLPGTTKLANHDGLKALIQQQADQKQKIAAICAAPSILGNMNLLKGKEAICYPGFESSLNEAHISDSNIVMTESIFTAKAAGVAIQFALSIVENIKGKELADKIARSIFL